MLEQATYKGEFRDDDPHDSKEVDDKVRQVVVRVVCAKQEQRDRDAKQELFGWCVLGAVVDLLPHVEVVKGATVELEGYASHIMEHDI